jgi:hypothetical protein
MTKHQRPLTDRQLAFCRYTVAGMTGAEAARSSGFSKSTAKVQASRLLKNRRIQAEIASVRRQTGRVVGPAVIPATDPSQARDRKVNDMMTGAIEGAARTVRVVDAADLELRRVMDRELAAAIDADYLDAAMIENLEIALGRRPFATTRIFGRGKTAEVRQILAYERDGNVAHRTAELLYRRVALRSDAAKPHAAAAYEELPDSVKKAIEEARRVARREK